jgi:hypothetical protein
MNPRNWSGLASNNRSLMIFGTSTIFEDCLSLRHWPVSGQAWWWIRLAPPSHIGATQARPHDPETLRFCSIFGWKSSFCIGVLSQFVSMIPTKYQLSSIIPTKSWYPHDIPIKSYKIPLILEAQVQLSNPRSENVGVASPKSHGPHDGASGGVEAWVVIYGILWPIHRWFTRFTHEKWWFHDVHGF